MSNSIPRTCALTLTLALAPLASAQSFNVDCVSLESATVPSDNYGGVPGQTGNWAKIKTSAQVEDLNGNLLGVWLLVPPQQPGDGDDTCTSGDDENLMDDAHSPANVLYRFSGLIPGDYRVYTYAMAPGVPTYLTDVGVTNSPDPVQTVGGDFCGGHVQGVTYSLHHVTTTDGFIFIDITVNANFATVNGFQLVCDTCTTGIPLCFGNNGAQPCPCGNAGSSSSGCANGTGMGTRLSGTGNPLISNDDVVLTVDDGVPGQPGLFFQGNNAINGGNGTPFGDGLRCCGSNVVRLQIRVPDAGGNTNTTVPIAATGGVSPGDVRCYQFWYRDPAGSPCGAFFNLSNGYSITWL